MIRDLLRLHFRYAGWATARVFDAAAQLRPEQRAIPGHAGHGSIHDTLCHLVEVQHRWWLWFDGSLPPEQAIQVRLDAEQVADLDALRATWEATNARALALIESSTDDDLARVMELAAPGMPIRQQVPLWSLMLHVANHGTQHRSEVAAMLTEHGISPGGLDMVFYLFEAGVATG